MGEGSNLSGRASWAGNSGSLFPFILFLDCFDVRILIWFYCRFPGRKPGGGRWGLNFPKRIRRCISEIPRPGISCLPTRGGGGGSRRRSRHRHKQGHNRSHNSRSHHRHKLGRRRSHNSSCSRKNQHNQSHRRGWSQITRPETLQHRRYSPEKLQDVYDTLLHWN